MKIHLLLLLSAGLAGIVSSTALAQTGPRQSPGLQQPTLRDDEQIMPSQIVPAPGTPKPKPKPAAPKPPPVADNPPDNPDADTAKSVVVAKPAAPPKPAEPPRVVTCSGAFVKTSGHLRLAQSYGVRNVEFRQVAGDDGSTMLASVLFPNDPKRRLEVLWDDDTLRTGTRMIVIDGQSTWTAEKGLRLGMPLAALEKLNGKPFKMLGFGAAGASSGMAMASDWNGGALDLLTDGCKVGAQFKPDAKATPDVIQAASGKEFLSSDAAIRAAKPIIGEIIVGY
jgi:hypothetical protein